MVGSHVAEAVQVAGSFMAVLSFGIVLDLPKKYLGWSGVTGGGVCWLVYLLIREETGSLIFAAFLSGLSVALLGHILARILRAPVSVFLIPGILPLVPGTSIYNCVYNIIRSSREQSTYYLIETMQIAGAIAMAVFLMDSMFKMIKNKDKNRA
ncbi:threonine/serine exporter family protein [Enterocloster citroniae]